MLQLLIKFVLFTYGIDISPLLHISQDIYLIHLKLVRLENKHKGIFRQLVESLGFENSLRRTWEKNVVQEIFFSWAVDAN